MDEKKKKGFAEITAVFKEAGRILKNFFVPYKNTEEILEVPKDVRKQGSSLGWIDIGFKIVGVLIPWILKAVNVSVEKKLIGLAVFLYCLTKSRGVANSFLRMISEDKKTAYSTISNNKIIEVGARILKRTINRVRIYDKKKGYWRILSNTEIINTLKSFINSYWDSKVNHKFFVINMTVALGSLILAIITNHEIPQKIFIPLVLFFSIVAFCSAAYTSRNNRDTFKQNQKEQDQQDQIFNDILNVPEIVPGDLEWRLELVKEKSEKTKNNMLENMKKNRKINLAQSILEFLSQCALIIMYVVTLIRQGETIELGTIALLTANLAVVETAIGYVSELGYILTGFSDKQNKIYTRLANVKEILSVFHKQESNAANAKPRNSITIKPFEVKYEVQSENDIAFTLISENEITVNSGEVVVMFGPSGAGKSTMINLIVDRIALEKTSDIPSTSRALIYDENLRFGSLDMKTEIFCNSPKPDTDRMEEILTSLQLTQELKPNSSDFWRWMSEHDSNVLSNGQNQRMLLAKMLYHRSKDIDIYVFDEATSGLDESSNDEANADAEKILKYLIEYCNQDKKRILVISTHQNISGVEKALDKKYKFKKLLFRKEGQSSKVTQIN